MKEHWQERLLKMDDLDERRLLRGVLLTAFTNIEEYTNLQLEAIKQRVFDESKLAHDLYNIYTSVISINEYDPINDFLFPMDEADLKELPFDATVITETMDTGEKPLLGKLYFELDHLALRKISKTLPGRRFKGQLKTSRDTYQIEISLSPYLGYQKQVEKLYELYLENNIAWRTVLHPSIYKFMEMRLETEIEFKKREKIEEIIIELEELDAHKQINQIPLWNIKTQPFNNQGFAIPAGDRINFEHVLVFEEDVRKLAYLVDSVSVVDGIINIRMETDRLILTSSKQAVVDWHLWMIVNPLEDDLEVANLTSNCKVESFIDNFSSRAGRVIRTIGEVYRIANSFEHAADLKLADVVMDAGSDVHEESYELNFFVKDEIRKDKNKKIMKLIFTTGRMTPFTRDLMSFLVSEISLYFPEYRCVGVLV